MALKNVIILVCWLGKSCLIYSNNSIKKSNILIKVNINDDILNKMYTVYLYKDLMLCIFSLFIGNILNNLTFYEFYVPLIKPLQNILLFTSFDSEKKGV